MDNIWTIVPAAGASVRMGEPKLLLPYNGKTILETVISTAAEVTGLQIMVVLDPRQEEILRLVKNIPAPYTCNPDPSRGMLSSIICGIDAIPASAGAFFLFLGDQPQVQAEVACRLKEAWMNQPGGIFMPVTGGKRGHPVLISTRFRENIRNLPPEEGLKGLMRRHPEEIRELEMDTPEILRDIDTPSDYLYELEWIDKKIYK